MEDETGPVSTTRRVIRWGALALGTLIWGSGVAAMYGDDYKLAVCLYLVGIVIGAIDFITLGEHREYRGFKRVVLMGSTALVATITFGLSLGWIHLRKIDVQRQGAVKQQTEARQGQVPPQGTASENAIPKTKGSAKIEDRSAHGAEHYDLSSVTEAFWFGIYVQASKALKDNFTSVDDAAMRVYGGSYSVNTIDNRPAESYETAWQSTFGKVLLCNPKLGVSSSMNFVLSQHPYISVSISNNSVSGQECKIRGQINRPVMTGETGFVLTGPSGRWPHHAYILDVPVTRDVFTVRFFMNDIELKQLTGGYLPPWKSFAINDAKEVLQLQIYRKGATQWFALPELDQFLPGRITLKTDLMYGGPKIVREYKLLSRLPQRTGRGDDASQIFIWAFTWQPIRYAEEHSEFSGN